MGPIGYLEMSVNKYQHTLRNISEERRPQLPRRLKLNFCNVYTVNSPEGMG